MTNAKIENINGRPAITVNGEVYGRLIQADVQSICDKYIDAE